MRPTCGSFVSAPSSSLLRFLRSQSQDLCFFTPNSKSTFRHHSHRPTKPLSRSHDSERYRLVARRFTTSQRRQATVEASFFNRELFRQSPHNLLKPLWRLRGRLRASTPRSDEFPPLPKYLNEANSTILGRSKAGKPSNAHILRCTEIDENGRAPDGNREFKKSELIAKVGICARAAEK